MGMKQPQPHITYGGRRAELASFSTNVNGGLFFHGFSWDDNYSLNVFTDTGGSADVGGGTYINGQRVHYPWSSNRDCSLISFSLSFFTLLRSSSFGEKQLASKTMRFFTGNAALVTLLKDKLIQSCLFCVLLC